jgi:hypothetical protein
MRWQQLADDVALLSYPLRALGIDFGRRTTLLRLRDGRLVVHSSAPFTAKDVVEIRRFGEPAWLVEATEFHDTFARAAQAALPNVPYLTPARLHPPPPDWSGQIEILRIDGLRKIDEHAFFHTASRTLVLADLFFHFPPSTRGWPRFFIRKIMRLPRMIGISRFFRFTIRDEDLFANSMRELLKWDFQTIVVAHREPITTDARAIFVGALREEGLAVDA